MSSTNLRALVAGTLAGLMLSVSRAPLGLDLIHLAVVDEWTGALFRVLPWVLLAGLLALSKRSFPEGVPTTWLAGGVSLGVLLESFALQAVWQPKASSSLVMCLALLALGIALLGVGLYRALGALSADW